MPHGPVSKKRLFSCTGGCNFVLSTSHQLLQASFCRTETAFVLFQKASDIWQFPKKNHHLKFIFSLGFCSLEVCFLLPVVCEATGKKYHGYFCPCDPIHCSAASLIMAPGDPNSQLKGLRLGWGRLGDYRQCLGRKEGKKNLNNLVLTLVLAS